MTRAELQRIIGDALEVPPEAVTDDASSQTLEAWDSVGHINILVALDTATNGAVAGIAEMQDAYSFEQIATALRQHGLLT